MRRILCDTSPHQNRTRCVLSMCSYRLLQRLLLREKISCYNLIYDRLMVSLARYMIDTYIHIIHTLLVKVSRPGRELTSVSEVCVRVFKPPEAP